MDQTAPFITFLEQKVLNAPGVVSCMIVMRIDGSVDTYTDDREANPLGWTRISAQIDLARGEMAKVILNLDTPHDPFGPYEPIMPRTITIDPGAVDFTKAPFGPMVDMEFKPQMIEVNLSDPAAPPMDIPPPEDKTDAD